MRGSYGDGGTTVNYEQAAGRPKEEERPPRLSQTPAGAPMTVDNADAGNALVKPMWNQNVGTEAACAERLGRDARSMKLTE